MDEASALNRSPSLSSESSPVDPKPRGSWWRPGRGDGSHEPRVSKLSFSAASDAEAPPIYARKRSAWRKGKKYGAAGAVLGTGAGIYVAVKYGAVIGGMIGSSIPIGGTIAGIVVGGLVAGLIAGFVVGALKGAVFPTTAHTLFVEDARGHVSKILAELKRPDSVDDRGSLRITRKLGRQLRQLWNLHLWLEKQDPDSSSRDLLLEAAHAAAARLDAGSAFACEAALRAGYERTDEESSDVTNQFLHDLGDAVTARANEARGELARAVASHSAAIPGLIHDAIQDPAGLEHDLWIKHGASSESTKVVADTIADNVAKGVRTCFLPESDKPGLGGISRDLWDGLDDPDYRVELNRAGDLLTRSEETDPREALVAFARDPVASRNLSLFLSPAVVRPALTEAAARFLANDVGAEIAFESAPPRVTCNVIRGNTNDVVIIYTMALGPTALTDEAQRFALASDENGPTSDLKLTMRLTIPQNVLSRPLNDLPDGLLSWDVREAVTRPAELAFRCQPDWSAALETQGGNARAQRQERLRHEARGLVADLAELSVMSAQRAGLGERGARVHGAEETRIRARLAARMRKMGELGEGVSGGPNRAIEREVSAALRRLDIHNQDDLLALVRLDKLFNGRSSHAVMARADVFREAPAVGGELAAEIGKTCQDMLRPSKMAWLERLSREPFVPVGLAHTMTNRGTLIADGEAALTWTKVPRPAIIEAIEAPRDENEARGPFNLEVAQDGYAESFHHDARTAKLTFEFAGEPPLVIHGRGSDDSEAIEAMKRACGGDEEAAKGLSYFVNQSKDAGLMSALLHEMRTQRGATMLAAGYDLRPGGRNIAYEIMAPDDDDPDHVTLTIPLHWAIGGHDQEALEFEQGLSTITAELTFDLPLDGLRERNVDLEEALSGATDFDTKIVPDWETMAMRYRAAV